MSKIIPTNEAPTWKDVPYLETTDRVIGGIAGSSNASALALHERTEYLKEAITDISQGSGVAITDVYNDINLHGNTFTNMGDAVASSDPVALGQLSSSDSGKGASLIGGLIADNVTLEVPSQYATIKAAVDYVATKTIVAEAYVTIRVDPAFSPYDYSEVGSIYFYHPQGERIAIVGNRQVSDNALVANSVLDYGTSDFDAFVAYSGATIGYLNGFTLQKDARVVSGVWNAGVGLDKDLSTGVLAVTGATIICGTNMEVHNFYYGIAAREGAHIKCSKAIVSGSGDVGIWAFTGSMIYCDEAESYGAKDITDGTSLGFGFQAEYGSTINGNTIIAHDCHRAGIAALSNSCVRALSASVSYNNIGHGLFAIGSGYIEAHNANLYGNAGFGYHTEDFGSVLGSNITFIGAANTLGNYSNQLDISPVEADGTARIAPSKSGPLRVDVQDSSPTYFNNSYGLNFIINGSGNTTTGQWEARGASTGNSNQAVFVAVGDANQSGAFYSSGVGALYFNTGNGLAFSVADNGGAATGYLKVGAATTGLGDQVTLDFTGTATDIGVRYRIKGTASHYFSTDSGNAIQFDITHTANANRRVRVTGSFNANPKISASGGSLDIGSAVVFTSQTVGTTVGAAGGASALPATPLGYLTTSINGTVCKIPYYN